MSKKDYGVPYTDSQRRVIEERGTDLLVSASAGTGKTTVMIERIAEQLSENVDISEIVVVTFTNLAAAEMKNRLALKLSSQKNNKRLIDQLERIDSANICTLHSFCGELLRNYFYVADVDPAYVILDANLTANLRQAAMEEIFNRYFDEHDEIFDQTYKIFATNRRQENFYDVLFRLYDFSRCTPDFNEWYAVKRQNLVNLNEDNPVIALLFDDIRQNLDYYRRAYERLAQNAAKEGIPFADAIALNAKKIAEINTDSFENALKGLYVTSVVKLPDRPRGKAAAARSELQVEAEENARYNFDQITDGYSKFYKRYGELCRGLSLQELREQTFNTVPQLDKLVEIINRFDEVYSQMKKDRGGVDFNDLEHLALKILRDPEAFESIRARCKLIFVDEYQDTNPVQEAIVTRLADAGKLFMVGDVKQSIYGFRGCEPDIFAAKEKRFERQNEGTVIRLNDNFRSNVDILDFVNSIFNNLMTDDFGKVDYIKDAQLKGNSSPVLTQAPSVRLDFVIPDEAGDDDEETGVYDITAQADTASVNKEAAVIINRIKQYVGMRYTDKKGNDRVVEYGDIVILLRTFQDKAVALYNALVSANVPVVANFNADGYSSKEIKDLINLMRVLDNPYNDVYLTGACLSCFGGFSESELGTVRLHDSARMPFYDRLRIYADKGANRDVADKASKLLKLLEELRFYSRSASVSEVILKTLELTQYHLYVQGLPNGGLRLRKMYSFIDSVSGVGYAQSVDGFLSYLDESEDIPVANSVGASNAVRMMTMHASKGLEFPVVIIADLGHKFKNDRDMLQCNFDMGVAMNYYDFDSMTYAPTLASTAYRMRNLTKANEEQMRLLYVALTRAKFALDIVATVTIKQLNAMPKQAKDANSHLDWLLLSLKQNGILSSADGIKQNGKTEINVITELAEQTADALNVDRLPNQETDEKAVLNKLSFKYRYEDQRDMPVKVVSSALDKSYINVHDQPEVVFTQDDDRNFVGTAYHKVYQYVNHDADVNAIRQTVEALVADGQTERRIADKLDVNLIYDTLRNPQLRQILKSGTVYRELPFMLYAPYNHVDVKGAYRDEVMLQGVIDLLVIGDDRATVVDFKYTSRADRVKDNYAAQINSYKLAVNKICGINNVDCYILSISDNKLIKFD